MRTFTVVMAGAALLALAACKETTRIESKEAAPAAAPKSADNGPGVEVRTNNDTIKVDSTGVKATVKTDS